MQFFVPITKGVILLAVLGIVAATVFVTMRVLDSDEPGWSSDGITINRSSWEPGDDTYNALSRSVVRIDASGCVHLRRDDRRIGVNVIWPDGYTASRRSNGTVTILNADDTVVSVTRHRFEALGRWAPPDTELACRALHTRGKPFMIQDDLPPLSP